MILRLEMPLIDPSLRGGRVARWRKAEGDRINFGDELCVVALDEFAALRRTARATLLAGRRRKRLKSDLEVREGKVFIEISITSSDQGVMRKILKGEGDPIVIGDTMAIVASADDRDAAIPADWAGAPVMRVVANHAGGHSDFEEEG